MPPSFDNITNFFQGSSLGKLAGNFSKTASEFGKVLYRDGSNVMTGPLDMNSRRILNVPTPIDDNDVVNLRSVRDIANTISKGPTGPANSTYASLTELKAAPQSNRSYILADGINPPATYSFVSANFTGRADDVNVVQLNSVPLTAGALIRQTGSTITFDKQQTVQSRLSLEVFTTDVRVNASGQFIGGAKADGVTDDSAAIQSLLDWVSANGGGRVVCVAGVSLITTSLKLPGNVSLDGFGQFSCILATVCNGVEVLASDVIGPRQVANIWFRGNGADNFSGIVIDVAFPSRVQGLVIENCYISFFGFGIVSTGLWHSTIRTNCIHQIHVGIIFKGRNVKVTVEDNRVTHGGLVTGTGNSIGIQVGDSSPGLRPEDIQVHNNLFFNFAEGLYWRQCLFGSATHNDFDYCTEVGIHFVTADGGTAFNDNWIQVDNTTKTIYGIRGEALGSLPGIDNVEIRNNRIRATDIYFVPGEMHSFGLDFANNQANIECHGNSLQGAFQVSLRADGVQRSNFAGNKGAAQAIIFNCRNSGLLGNTFEGGFLLSGNVAMWYAKNHGLHTTEITGSIDIPAGASSVTVTYLSLNMPDLPLGGYSISCSGLDRGNVTHGGLSAIPTRSGITIYAEKAIASLPSTVDFQVRIY